MNLDLMKSWEIFTSNIDMFLYGVQTTLIYALVGTIAGFIIGLVLGAIRSLEVNESDPAFIRILKWLGQWFTRLYIWVFRGTPMMVQAMFLYYGLQSVIGWDGPTAGLFVISINTGAYMAEIIRSGLQSVDKGQSEAAKSIGLTSLQTLIYIIFPQAIRNAFPSIGNQLIVNIKDSSMLNVVWVIELFTQSRAIAGSNYRPVETYFVAAVIYLILTTVATLVLNFIERKMAIEIKSRDLCA